VSSHSALSEADPQKRLKGILRVHAEVSACRVCEEHVDGFQKPAALDRGTVGQVMIVGQGPGQAEVDGLRAFAGQSGRTLERWLVKCGANPAAPRAGIYFTSVIKCACRSDKFFPLMAKNCRQFLRWQIAGVKPKLLITLGKRAYEALQVSNRAYDEALCEPQHTGDFVLVTPFGFHFSLLHWPHPSGLNRWLNVDENVRRLSGSFDFVRGFLGSTT
jgi:uracil-DNA glycosylase family 4